MISSGESLASSCFKEVKKQGLLLITSDVQAKTLMLWRENGKMWEEGVAQKARVEIGGRPEHNLMQGLAEVNKLFAAPNYSLFFS